MTVDDLLESDDDLDRTREDWLDEELAEGVDTAGDEQEDLGER
jgi:hypothetical protein